MYAINDMFPSKKKKLIKNKTRKEFGPKRF